MQKQKHSKQSLVCGSFTQCVGLWL